MQALRVTRIAGFGLLALVGLLVASSDARAEDWGRYYHWPHNSSHQYQWSPYEYRQVYDGNFRYPVQDRVYPSQHGWRNWSTVRKPFYKGNHFILDRF